MQAWCDRTGSSSTLSDETIELYCRFVCKEQRVGRGQARASSFKYAAQHILALRDLRLQQLSEGLYSAREVWYQWAVSMTARLCGTPSKVLLDLACRSAIHGVCLPLQVLCQRSTPRRKRSCAKQP